MSAPPFTKLMVAIRAAFAQACVDAGIQFIGPRVEHLEQLGDKLVARRIATQAGVPVLSGSERPLASASEAAQVSKSLGFPVLLKAARGGGGRGMRVVE